MFYSKNSRLIVETIFDDPDAEHHVRSLAEEAGLAPSTVSRITENLEDQNVIEIKKGDIKNKITASQDKRFKDLKRSYNLYRLSETGLIEEIMEESFPEAIILFGSYSRGEDKKDSDIDIAVVNGRQPDLDLREYEEELARQINITNATLEEASENFIQTLANGITLRGYLEV